MEKDLRTYRAGIDVGSTTVKLAVLNEEGTAIFGEYRRHHAQTQETLGELLALAAERLGPCALRLCITGSGSMGLSKALGIPFVQEVVAVADALRSAPPGPRRTWPSNWGARTPRSSTSGADWMSG